MQKAKSEINNLEKIIAKESEMLCHLEAKLPPHEKFRTILLKKDIYTEWVSRLFALLAGIEYQYGKEESVFSKLKKNKKIRLTVRRRARSDLSTPSCCVQAARDFIIGGILTLKILQ